MLGRVGASLSAFISSTGPAGPIFAGWLAQKWSVGIVFVLSGAIIVVVLGLSAATMTSLRKVQY